VTAGRYYRRYYSEKYLITAAGGLRADKKITGGKHFWQLKGGAFPKMMAATRMRHGVSQESSLKGPLVFTFPSI
jgi:hypothetical protein